jgi:hypothetical protein
MKRIFLFALLLYIVVGAVAAVRWSAKYDPKNTSFPNNAKTFIINVLTWPM